MVLKLNRLLAPSLPRLTRNDRRVLKILLKDSRITDVEMGRRLSISPQAAFKIRRKLEERRLILNYSAIIDYSQFGINALALVMMDVHDATESQRRQIRERISANLINVSKLISGTRSYIILFGFSDVAEMYSFFNEIQANFPNQVRLNHIYTFHIEGLFKNSSKDLFYWAVNNFGKESFLPPPKLDYHSFNQIRQRKKKLSKNEISVLKALVGNSRATAAEIIKKMPDKALTERGVGKIRERLEQKKIIRGYSVKLNYSLLGIGVLLSSF